MVNKWILLCVKLIAQNLTIDSLLDLIIPYKCPQTKILLKNNGGLDSYFKIVVPQTGKYTE